ncbi:GntR family transcriptional regulator [Marivirga sp. S37H4]|uniref:GntR family transcriptional regulator n=1 Tax=Marivirga aurantiaca TaxID=2802615 RepID=A0A934X1L4_9BACT|nr:GntR family transcriptional regulator [Marivirga aurantiaca]MBK6267318.1 GntR family transcriptional regulator [Marivirga aurantiaca]
MEFQNGKSIFLQIADTITDKVVSGEFPAGEKIPSVRELAAEMGVNPNTIMRTYSELQAMNIIENQRGIGYFVNPEAQHIILKSKKEDFFNKVLPEVLKQADLLGITSSELKKHLDNLNSAS